MSLWERHKIFETNPLLLLFGALVVIAIGGIVEIVPLFYLSNTIETVDGVRPYTPLELAGRNIYVREGCYNCHSQMIRSLRDEVERYGHYSLAAESMYDRPFQWGSKRTGPDLARVGGKYSDTWHVDHLNAPSSVVPATVMPAYPWLARTELDIRYIDEDLLVQQTLGVPYTDEMIENAPARRGHARDARRRRQQGPAGALPQRQYPRLHRHGGGQRPADRGGCADRLSAVARHRDRLQSLRRQRQHPLRSRPMSDTYTALAEFAQSWGLLYFVAVFVIVLLMVMRPSQKRRYDQAARLPLSED